MNKEDKKIIWIASYPKSGNTWIRSFLTSYYCTLDGSFNFDLLKNIPTFESDLFSPYISKEEAAKNPEDISRYWIEVQKNSQLKNGNFIFLKTHNFCGEINNYPFTSSRYTIGFIYIVRDPREVAVSYSNHFNIDLEDSVNIISASKPTIVLNKGINYPVFTYNWGVNYTSWKAFNNVPNLIVKYEDMISEPELTFKNIINFLNDLGLPTLDPNKLSNSLKNTSFSFLQDLEETHGFKEQFLLKDIKFFNRGSIDSWKTKLTSKLVKKIENKFYKEMDDLNYL
tara:strand:- start:8 stop:856 length:849 start_codon:yes stop_codon:yes gene_type:complete